MSSDKNFCFMHCAKFLQNEFYNIRAEKEIEKFLSP